MATNWYYAGQLVRVATYTGSVTSPSGGFRDINGNLADPATVVLSWRASETGTVTSVTYPALPVIRDGTGLYHADLDTTGSAEAMWTYEWAGSGGVQAVAANSFIVRNPLS